MIVLLCKDCTKCGATLPLESFYDHPLGQYGKQPACKSCNKKQVYSSQRKHIHIHKARRYGADPALIECLLRIPVCQACGQRFTAYGKERLDHCHERSHMRGVLCHRCNITCQGTADEAIFRLRACLAYLERDMERQALCPS